MYYLTCMIETADMAKIPDFLTENERLVLFGSECNLLKSKMVSFRLTGDARDILAREAERFGTNKTKALEILLREIREIRKCTK